MRSFFILLILKMMSPGQVTASGQQYARAIEKMTSDLYLELAKESDNKNIVISPLSIHTAMSMLQYGADGYSQKQLRGALGLNDISKVDHLTEISNLMNDYEDLNDENVTLNIANGLYGASDLNVHLKFVNLVENQFDATYKKIDFSDKKKSVKTINDWAANKTNNLIQELVSEESLDTDVRMVIMNAVYFKAKWLKRFNEKGTSQRTFIVPGKGAVKTDFMFLSDSIESATIKELNATLLALPYIDEDYKMLIFHPHKTSSIEELEQTLFSSNKTIAEYTLKLEEQDTRLYFPKFETGSDISLVNPFQGLEVTDIFSDRANFSGISDEKNIKVGNIIHKTKIKVSEEGSEAAAVTGAVLDTRSGPLQLKLSIDSPFIFFIQDTKRNIPLFMGKIVNPSMERVDDIIFEKALPAEKPQICPGGDLDTCTDDCGFKDTRSHRICTGSCAKKCPDME